MYHELRYILYIYNIRVHGRVYISLFSFRSLYEPARTDRNFPSARSRIFTRTIYYITVRILHLPSIISITTIDAFYFTASN